MSRYTSRYTGPRIDEALERALGYGLGSETPTVTEDWNNAVRAGFYYGKVNSPNGSWVFGIVAPYTSGYVAQRVWYFYNTSITCVAERVCYNGTWLPWEWVNPPMEANEEYRTTERYMSRVVYRKAISWVPSGTIPAGLFTVPHDISNFGWLVDCSATINYGDILPIFDSTNDWITDVARVSTTEIRVYNENPYYDQNYVWQFNLAYTKTE